jgi:hypothetical protein
MTYATATFPGVPVFGDRAFPLGDYRRVIFRGAVGFGTVSAIAGALGVVTVAAAWLSAACLATNSNLRTSAPIALEAAALAKPNHGLAGVADVFGLAVASTRFAAAPNLAQVAELTPAAAPSSAPDGTLAPPPQRTAENVIAIPLPPPRPRFDRPIEAEQIARSMPLPLPRPTTAPQIAARHEPPAESAAPLVTASIAPTPAPASLNFFPRSPKPQQASISLLPAPGGRTAVYDIEAHTVYLPNGDRLEAHSGLGKMLDDPHYVDEKGRGATPPNVYDLVLRKGLFHGVQAIRLDPVGNNTMFGRDGILAHPYMLGPTGQSFGCVSFKDYQEFLQAYQHGEVDRLVVVSHLDTKPSLAARGGYADRYAADY